jgi:putative membrane protein
MLSVPTTWLGQPPKPDDGQTQRQVDEYRILPMACAVTITVRVMTSDAAGTVRSGGRVARFALRRWLVIVLVVLAAIFVSQNRDRHPIHVLWVTVESPTWFVLTVIFVVGLVTGLLLSRRRR